MIVGPSEPGNASSRSVTPAVPVDVPRAWSIAGVRAISESMGGGGCVTSPEGGVGSVVSEGAGRVVTAAVGVLARSRSGGDVATKNPATEAATTPKAVIAIKSPGRERSPSAGGSWVVIVRSPSIRETPPLGVISVELRRSTKA